MGKEVPERYAKGYLADDESKGVNFMNAIAWVDYEGYLTRVQEERKLNYWDDSALAVVHENEEFECTCGQFETRGSCKRHGLKDGGLPSAKRAPMPEDQRRAISQRAKGHLRNLKTGKYTNQVPQLRCDECHLKGRCPGFADAALCTYDDEFSGLAQLLGDRNWQSIVDFQWGKMAISAVLLQRMLHFATMDGGLVSKEVQGMLSQLTTDTKLMARLMGGMQKSVTIEDNRRIANIIVQDLPEADFVEILDAVANIRDVAPQLLEAGEEE